MVHEPTSSRIEIEEPFGSAGRWLVNLEAKRVGEAVHVNILDRLVIAFTPEEAREFAQALNRVAGASTSS
jgi:hypothetical protein